MIGGKVERIRPSRAQRLAAARGRKTMCTRGLSALRLFHARQRIARQELQEAKESLTTIWMRASHA